MAKAKWRENNPQIGASACHSIAHFPEQEKTEEEAGGDVEEVGESLGFLNYFSWIITIKKKSGHHTTARMIYGI